MIMTTVLAEFDGLNRPSALGLRPFEDNDPSKPNEAYFDRIVEIVEEAESNRLYVALLPTWGDKLTAPWGLGPRIFRKDNLPVARSYARYLGGKLRNYSNVVWILGGDRPASLAGLHNKYLQDMATMAGFAKNEDWTEIWRQIAAGLAEGLERDPVTAYHPQGGPDSSSQFLHGEKWLSINGMQSGHGGGHDVPVWDWIVRDYALEPHKPTLDLEPNYEDHPYNPWPNWDPATGFFRDYDVRKQTYRSVFAGAAGVSYGHHSVWGFANLHNGVENHADMDWIAAMERPGGREMIFLRLLIESRPFFTRIPDQRLILGDAGNGGAHLQATRDREGTYALIYFPQSDQTATLDLRLMAGKTVRAWWYDPRTGVGTLVGEIEGGKPKEFRSPPYGPDWVLVLDSKEKHYGPPGIGVFPD
ncbi:MAG: glycoside hydrolase family 140 protein [Candidatus Acidiferrum sp.]